MKITQAADCRDFVKRKQEEDALRAAQKRKKQMPWGYDVSLSLLMFMFAIISAMCHTLDSSTVKIELLNPELAGL